jgi:type I restriction enzyme S subunit
MIFELSIGDTCIVKGGKRLPKGHQLLQSKTKHPYIRTRDLNDHKININEIEYITPETHKEIERYIVDKGNLIISIVGTIGSCAIIPDNLDKANLTENCAKIVPKDSSMDTNFLYYFLISKFGQNEIYKNTVGSTQLKLPLYGIKNIKIPSIDKKSQARIADFLSTLDKKIELNQKMNETLEEIAKMLFKSWFIDFDPVRAKAERRPTGLSKEISNLFPDSFEDSEIGEIPKGWHTTSLDHITSKFTTGLNPRKNFVLGSGNNFYVTIKNLGDFEVVLDDKCDKVDNDAIKKINSRSDLKENDILFSGIGTIGKVVYVFDSAKNWNISESVFSLRANSEVTFPSFLYQLLKSYPLQGYVQALAGGSVQKGIRMGALKEYKFSLSNFEVQQLFNETISPMIKKISLNLNETKSLINIRDTLLPNLISGELKIADAESLIEEASI